jgi:hypothetical protein
LRLCLPHQRAFIALDRKQVALRLRFALLPRFMRQCCGIVGLARNLAVERGDQRIFVEPRDQRERVGCFREGQ